MTDMVVTARKWGNSVGVTISQEVVEREKIKPSDRLIISVRKVTPLSKLFGTWKTKKTAQQIKDELKKGWD
ncbi:MAG: hypothetical protein V1777_00860 [Candidatus Micrarchaeota archaeon]